MKSKIKVYVAGPKTPEQQARHNKLIAEMRSEVAAKQEESELARLRMWRIIQRLREKRCSSRSYRYLAAAA